MLAQPGGRRSERSVDSGGMCLPAVVPHRPLTLPRLLANLKRRLASFSAPRTGADQRRGLPSAYSDEFRGDTVPPKTALNHETFTSLPAQAELHPRIDIPCVANLTDVPPCLDVA